MGKANHEFDEHLFTLKLSEPARQLHIKSQSCAKRASRRAGGFYSHNGLIQIVDAHLAVSREFLELIDRICREVWQAQGKMVTPNFVRDVLVPKALS